LRGKEQMYSPSRGDVRAAVPQPKVQHDSTSSSMPLEHSSAWQREPPLYTRDGRVERLDRNVSVKRDWSAEQAPATPVNHKAIGLSSTNGNGLGHRSKHRVQGNCFSSEMFQVVETQVFLL
jgi:nuclear receptor co-repressor 1